METPNIRRISKIARLPKEIRAQINRMLDEGSTYEPIVEWLEQNGHGGISVRNVSTWKDTGYQDWLAAQAILADIQTLREFADDLKENAPDATLQEAALQLGSIRLLRHLRDLDPEQCRKQMADQPYQLVSLLHCLVGLNSQHLRTQKYKAQQEPRLLPDKVAEHAPKSPISEASIKRFEQENNLC